MKELFERLESTTDIVVRRIECAGFSSEDYYTIEHTESYMDGLEVFTNENNHFFISSLANTLLEYNNNEYILKSSNGSIVSFLFIKEEE